MTGAITSQSKHNTFSGAQEVYLTLSTGQRLHTRSRGLEKRCVRVYLIAPKIGSNFFIGILFFWNRTKFFVGSLILGSNYLVVVWFQNTNLFCILIIGYKFYWIQINQTTTKLLDTIIRLPKNRIQFLKIRIQLERQTMKSQDFSYSVRCMC